MIVTSRAYTHIEYENQAVEVYFSSSVTNIKFPEFASAITVCNLENMNFNKEQYKPC